MISRKFVWAENHKSKYSMVQLETIAFHKKWKWYTLYAQPIHSRAHKHVLYYNEVHVLPLIKLYVTTANV